MNREQKKIIIFDMDGVILDSEPLHEHARQMMFRKYTITPDENMPEAVGKSSSGFWRKVSAQYGLEKDPYDLEAEQYRLVAEQIEKNQVPPSEGLLDVMDGAKARGLKIGLASSSTRVLVDDALRLLGIRHYFDYTVSGNEVDRKKPAPDVYLKVLELAGMEPCEAVAVEDSAAGAQAAAAAGIFCYGYINETSGVQDMSTADIKIHKLSEIVR